MHKLGYIENYSSGLNRIFKEYSKDKNKPVIETTLIMFKVTFPNLNYNFDDTVKDTVNDTVILSDIEQNILNEIKKNCHITYQQLMNKLSKSRLTIVRGINSLKEKLFIKRVGSDKSGHWEIIE